MEFTLVQLCMAFLYSVISGLILGLVYEIFRLSHIAGLTCGLYYFISDIVYMIICGLFTYFFCLVFLEGKVRLFVIIGEILGFFVYYNLLVKVFNCAFVPILRIIKKIFKKLLKKSRILMYNIKSKLLSVILFFEKYIEGIKNEKNESGNRK